MEACVDLFRGPRSTHGNPPVGVFNLGRGGVPRGRHVAGQLSGTPLRAGLTRLTLCVPVLGSRGLSPSRSPALQLGPQGSLW
jgi:hypothetical protein